MWAKPSLVRLRSRARVDIDVILTVKVDLATAEDVTDSTTETTEDDASVAVSSRSSRTSALETAAQRPSAKRALTRILTNNKYQSGVVVLADGLTQVSKMKAKAISEQRAFKYLSRVAQLSKGHRV